MPDTPVATDPQLEPGWDLDPLVDGEDEAGVQRQLDKAARRARGLRRALRGQAGRAHLRRPGRGHARAGRDLGAGGARRLIRQPALRHRHRRPRARRAGAEVQELGTAIQTRLLFFELEWAALDDERAEELLAGDGLDFCRHYLRAERRYRPHLLTQPEEKIVTEKGQTGRSAWSRLFSELTSAIEVDLPEAAREPDEGDGAVALDAALSRLFSPEREVRRSPAEAVTAGAGAGAAHARLRVQHPAGRTRRWTTACAATITGSPAATSPTRPPTSPCRRWSRPCAGATSCRGAGTGSRRSCWGSTGSPTTTGWPP